MLPTITLEGRAVADPELRFTQSGKAVVSLRVACSESKKKDDGTWEDGDKLFVNVSIWGDDAEAVAEHVMQGQKVTVTGRLYQREYETRDGDKRTSLEVKFATVAKPCVAGKGQRQQGRPSGPQPTSDPWATGGARDDQPPF